MITGAAECKRCGKLREERRAAMQLIDIGINLTHDSFDADRDAVLARAQAAGIIAMVVTGATLAASRQAVMLAATPRVAGVALYATAGVHPHHAAGLQPADEAALRVLLAQPVVVAVGECGLDYHRDFSPREAQRRAFAWQLQWGADCGKPLFLHQRAAHADFVALLREHRGTALHGVAHCFTGSAAELDDYLELGLHVGITGWICDERRGLHLRELVRRIPRGRLLLETDGPYLLPRDLKLAPRHRRNESAYLPHIAATVAACRGESPEDCAGHTTAAARRLFGL
jgi:TatD DNase family protein